MQGEGPLEGQLIALFPPRQYLPNAMPGPYGLVLHSEKTLSIKSSTNYTP